MNKLNSILCLLLMLCAVAVMAQQAAKNKLSTKPAAKKNSLATGSNSLFQFGVADAFINGVYRGGLPLSELKRNGDFGLGAPNLVDGEITVYNGKVYQTKSTGQTVEAPDALTTPFSFVTFFKADTTFTLVNPGNQTKLYQLLDAELKNKNGMYAIKITGSFSRVKTRAFSAFSTEPFPALAAAMDKQQLFEKTALSGVLIGYRLPAYLAGINIKGYHFHFLADQLELGGHALEFTAKTIKVEIAYINGFKLEVASDAAFKDYNFNSVNKADLEKVEKGN